MNTHRRKVLLLSLTPIFGALGVSSSIAQAFVNESDPQAMALGYKTDNSRVDASRYTKFSPIQSCGSCALYQGGQGSSSGGCALFAGKQVASNGWCSAYARKAGATPISPPPAVSPVQPQPGQQPTVTPKPVPKSAPEALSNKPDPIDQLRKKCARLGLSPGSEDYKLCMRSI